MRPRGIIIVFAACAVALGTLRAQEAKSSGQNQGGTSVEQTVNQLIPRLAATNVADRYAAQMELQALAVKSGRPGAKAERAEVAKILAAKAKDATVPQPARVWCVRQLEYVGDAESIPALTSLLNGPDAELKESARRALEKNPAPAASEVLRTALKQGGDASWKIGLIQALGERGDARAVALVQPYLADPKTGGAAAAALAKIASDDSIRDLWAAYDEGNLAAAEALILAGAHLVRQAYDEGPPVTGGPGLQSVRAVSAEKLAKAEKIFSRLYLAGTGQPGAAPAMKNPAAARRVRCAALVGLAKADPKNARKYISAELESADPRMQYAAVTAAVVAYGKDKVGPALALLLPRLSPTAKVFVLRQLDPSAEAQVISLTEDPDDGVRFAALETLGRIGGAASVPVLMTASTGSSSTKKAAVAALAKLPGSDADAALEKLAERGDASSRAVAIQTLAVRNDTKALPALITYAGEADQKVSEAACSALGKMGSDNQLEPVARLAMSGKTPAAEPALQAVAARTKNKPSAVKNLVALLPSVAPQNSALLFETLTVLGGPEALAAITNAMSNGNEQIKDAAVRSLANWPDFVAVEPLLVIASDANAKRVHQVLAIQGVVRLVKASESEPAEARLSAALRAMSAATRDEDKKLVLSAFAAIPDAKAADAIKPYLSDTRFGNEAGLAGVTLAESLRKSNKAAAKELAHAVIDAKVSAELTRKANAVLEKN